jgi:hypothetical protein
LHPYLRQRSTRTYTWHRFLHRFLGSSTRTYAWHRFLGHRFLGSGTRTYAWHRFPGSTAFFGTGRSQAEWTVSTLVPA